MLSNIRKVSKGPLGYSLRLLVLSLGLVLVVAACGGPETVTPSPRTPDAESVVPCSHCTGRAGRRKHCPCPTRAVPTPESGSVAPTPSTVGHAPDTASVAPAPTAPATPKAESVTPELLRRQSHRMQESTVPAPAAPLRTRKALTPAPVPSATPDTESVAPEATPTYSAHPPAHYGAATPSVEERIYDSDVIIRASLQSSEVQLLAFRGHRVPERRRSGGHHSPRVHVPTGVTRLGMTVNLCFS